MISTLISVSVACVTGFLFALFNSIRLVRYLYVSIPSIHLVPVVMWSASTVGVPASTSINDCSNCLVSRLQRQTSILLIQIKEHQGTHPCDGQSLYFTPYDRVIEDMDSRRTTTRKGLTVSENSKIKNWLDAPVWFRSCPRALLSVSARRRAALVCLCETLCLSVLYYVITPYRTSASPPQCINTGALATYSVDM